MLPAVVLLACALVVGCHRNLPPSPPASPESTPVEAAPPRAPYEVVPAELGDAGVLSRIRHRARLRRYGAVELERGVKPSDGRKGRDAETSDVLPVLGETPAQLRVVGEDDHARVAVWIPRGDAWRTALVRVELGNGAGDAGAWVEPGVKLELGEIRGDKQAVAITDDHTLAIDGAIATRLLGHVWIASAEELALTDTAVRKRSSWSPPSDPRARVQLQANEPIYAAPSTGARIVATVKRGTPAAVVAVRGAFTEVELWRPDVRVRGFVQSERVSPTELDLVSGGTGSGHGFGMSHVDRIEVPAGTCLFASAEGEVVGVQLELHVRLGRLHPRTKDGPVRPGWRLVYVGSDWRVLELYVHDLADDPKQPKLDSCAK